MRASLCGIAGAAFLLTPAPIGPVAGARADPLPRVPPGFSVSVFAAVGGIPTSLAFGPARPSVVYGPAVAPLYITDFAAGRVLVVDDLGGIAAASRVFASGFRNPLGVVVDKKGFVYVSDAEAPRKGPFGTRSYGRVWRLRDTNDDGVADEQRVVLKDLPNGRHNTNGMAIGRDGMLYVTNGNSTDDGIEGGDPEVLPWSGSVVRVDPDARGLSLSKLGRDALVATGMRNLYDVAFSPFDPTKLFIPMNGTDDARPESESETPVDELEDSDDLLYATDVADRAVADFGFPSCLYNVERRGNLKPYDNPHPGVIKRFGSCPKKKVPRPAASFGLHPSANGLAFQTTSAWGKVFRRDLFVAEFGNFFGDDVAGHRVVRVELSRSGRAVVREGEFLTGALPLDVTFDAGGAMYVADFSGDIYRVTQAVEVPRVVEVQINAFQFLPQALTIPEGTTVRWVNREVLGLAHKVEGQVAATADGGVGDASEINSRDLAAGAAHEVRFDTPGTWVYSCTISAAHSAVMHGKITVVPAGN